MAHWYPFPIHAFTIHSNQLPIIQYNSNLILFSKPLFYVNSPLIFLHSQKQRDGALQRPIDLSEFSRTRVGALIPISNPFPPKPCPNYRNSKSRFPPQIIFPCQTMVFSTQSTTFEPSYIDANEVDGCWLNFFLTPITKLQSRSRPIQSSANTTISFFLIAPSGSRISDISIGLSEYRFSDERSWTQIIFCRHVRNFWPWWYSFF